MAVEIHPMPPALPAELLERYRRISFPTLGHYLEEGATTSAIAPIFKPVKIVGRAVTVKIASPDSTLVHFALDMLEPGDALVIDTGGNTRHAPVGEMVALAAQCRGAAGIVVDGPSTDSAENIRMGFPVFSRGLTCLTTKLYGIAMGSINAPVTCDGVLVRPGDLVLGDDNGVLFLSPETAARVIAQAEASDAREPETREYLRRGGSLRERTGAARIVRERFGVER